MKKNCCVASKTWKPQDKKGAPQEFRYSILGPTAWRLSITKPRDATSCSIPPRLSCISTITDFRSTGCLGGNCNGKSSKQNQILCWLVWIGIAKNCLPCSLSHIAYSFAAQIAPNSLTLHTTVYANAESRVPISFGFHPYFGIPHVERGKWRLQLPSMHKLQLDAHGIPTGVSQAIWTVRPRIGRQQF